MSALKYLLITTVLAGFSSAGLAATATVVATVNGKKITEQQLDEYIKYRESATRQNLSKDKEALLEEMINRDLLMAQVKKHKLNKNKEIAYIIKQQTTDLYIQALLRDTDVAKPVSEDEIKKLYDEKVKNHHVKQYKISHILVKTKQDAENVIAKLDKGANFADLAKQDSTGPSAKQGGELGWLDDNQLRNMPNLAQAISEMKKGSYTKTPVESKYGWHVVELQDVKDVNPPPLKEVHNQIEAAIRQHRIQEYVKNLREKAKVDIKLK